MNALTSVTVITGPTASGKSQAALDLALKIGGEIINADSMQLYEHLPILTACPSTEDRALIPHHLYQILGSEDISSAAWWVTKAQNTIEDILFRGRIPLVVGGTGLYLHALTQGLSPIPDIPIEIRETARDRASQSSESDFFDYVCNIDPAVIHVLKPKDKQRLTRAVEVMLATGKSLFEWQKIPAEPSSYSFQKWLIVPDRDVLYSRINERFIRMIEAGAIDEVKALCKRPVRSDSPIFRALGVKEIQNYLQGDIDRTEMIEQGQQMSRRYAKRQLTWLRTQAMDYQIFDAAVFQGI